MDTINTNSPNWSSSAFSDVTCSCLERGEICWKLCLKTCQKVPEECSENLKAWQIVPDKCSRRLKWFHRLERLVHLAGCLFTSVWLFLHQALSPTSPAAFKRLPACQRSSIDHIFFSVYDGLHSILTLWPSSTFTFYRNLEAGNNILGDQKLSMSMDALKSLWESWKLMRMHILHCRGFAQI